MMHTQFYSELGKALYALAYADGQVQDAEIAEMDHHISKVLSTVPAEEEDIKEIIISKVSFRRCLENHEHPGDAEKSFLDFMLKQGKHVHQKHKKAALELLHHVAAAFKSTNKSESEVLKKFETYLL